MGEKEEKLENLSYKDLVRHLIEQVKQTNACFNALDERERIIQKQMERMQAEINHKARDTDITEIKGALKTIAATSSATKEAKAETKTDNRWIISTTITIILFTVLLILNRVWKP